MKSLFSYLIVFLGILFWIFRIGVCLMYSMGEEFICVPYSLNLEVAILFLTIPCIIFIIRRNIVAGVLYFGIYTAYFGTILYNYLTGIGGEGTVSTLGSATFIMMNALGILIPTLTFLDIVIQKSHFHPLENNTDWYYKNEKYERKFDERADRNQYKIK